MFNDYQNAKNKLLTFALDDECQSFFEKNNFLLELAYCKVFSDELADALRIFENLKNNDPRARWGCVLTGILLEKLTPYPTYFELRNFLEIDLNLLINYEKGKYVEEIVHYADAFSSVNPETYKYFGRVFFNNEIYSYAKFFLERAKNHLYQDPELHVLLATLYEREGNCEKALRSVENCLRILPQYFPAKNLKRKLTNI